MQPDQEQGTDVERECEPGGRADQDALVDESSAQSFPASDPPAHTSVTGVAPVVSTVPNTLPNTTPAAASQPDAAPRPPFPARQQPRPGAESALRPRPRFGAPLYRGADKLRGKVALITGGDSGIGRAVAVLFAREGAQVGLGFLPEERRDAEDTQAAVAAEGRHALLLPGDIRDPGYAPRAIAQLLERFGRLDVLVNNAAFQQHRDNLEELTEAQWERTFQTNICGYFRMTRAALPHLRSGAAIINTGSITGLEGSANLLDYAATKGAIHAFTKSLAQNLIERGVRVNCVAPGPVWTPLNPVDGPAERVAHFGEKTPLGRPAQPEEIAPAYVFFASPADSSFITGEVLTLLGGTTRAA